MSYKSWASTELPYLILQLEHNNLYKLLLKGMISQVSDDTAQKEKNHFNAYRISLQFTNLIMYLVGFGIPKSDYRISFILSFCRKYNSVGKKWPDVSRTDVSKI